MHPDRNTPGWLWGVCGAMIVAAVVVAWLLPAGAGQAKAGMQTAQPGVVRDGFLIREGAAEPREFDVHKCLVKPEELVALPVARGGIPAITHPVFVPAAAAQSVRPEELVLGLKIGNEARCYPLRILVWHGVVEDAYGTYPPGGKAPNPPAPFPAGAGGERPSSLRVVVSFDPLANAGMAVEAGKMSLSVAGRAYGGEGLVCDGQNLWSLLRGKALAGPLAGTKLKRLPLERMTFAAWRQQHAKTLVLHEDTGFDRPYDEDPYAHALIGDAKTPVDYWREEGAFIAPLPKPLDLGKFRAKELVLGVDVGGVTRAYPLAELVVAGAAVEEQIGTQTVKVTYDPRAHWAAATGGTGVFSTVCFWGVWRATHPDTTLYEAPRKKPGTAADAEV